MSLVRRREQSNVHTKESPSGVDQGRGWYGRYLTWGSYAGQVTSLHYIEKHHQMHEPTYVFTLSQEKSGSGKVYVMLGVMSTMGVVRKDLFRFEPKSATSSFLLFHGLPSTCRRELYGMFCNALIIRPSTLTSMRSSRE